MLVFDSDRFRRHERVDAYEGFFAASLSPLCVHPKGVDTFRVRADVRVIHDLSMARFTGSGYDTERTSREVARQREHLHVAIIHLDGRAKMESRTGSFEVRPGDVSMLSSMNTARFGLEARHDHIIIALPRRFPWDQVVVPEKTVDTSNPLRSIVADFVASAWAQAERLAPSAAALLADHIGQLIFAMCCEEPLRLPTSDSLRAAVFDRACRLISAGLQDPDLHPVMVARRLGIPLRQLQRIFQQRGATVAQRITAGRVDKSAAMLVEERMRQWTITQVAFACGFGDLTTFERCFHASKGMTPSAWRASGSGAA